MLLLIPAGIKLNIVSKRGPWLSIFAVAGPLEDKHGARELYEE